MAFRIAPDETLIEALHRIGDEQFDRALRSLDANDTVSASHETRKCIKRLRALLRLVRSGIGDEVFKEENSRLAEIGRALSGARDSDVVTATLATLAANHPEFRDHRRHLSASRSDNPAAPPMSLEAVRDEARESLQKARKRWRHLALQVDDDGAVLADGLQRCLRDLAAGMEAAREGDSEAVHDWRKAAQRHWRHMRLMEAAWPDYFRARQVEARAVSELLGRSQDLSLVVDRIKGADQHLDTKTARTLIGIIDAEQNTARDEARLRCSRLTAEGPRGHARRAMTYWTSAGSLEAALKQNEPEATQVPTPRKPAAKKRPVSRTSRTNERAAAAVVRTPRKSAPSTGRKKKPNPARR